MSTQQEYYMKVNNAYKQNYIDQNLKSFEEVCAAIVAMQNKMYDEKKVHAKLIAMKFDARYSDSVSNTHNCPVGGKTNWGRRDPGAPTGYPGFSGRVWLRFSKLLHPQRKDTFSSDHLIGTLLHTGTGGYGAYDGPYSITASNIYQSVNRTRDTIGRQFNDAEQQRANELRWMHDIYSYDARIFMSDFGDSFSEHVLGDFNERAIEHKLQTGKKLECNIQQVFTYYSDDATTEDEIIRQRTSAFEAYILGSEYETNQTATGN